MTIEHALPADDPEMIACSRCHYYREHSHSYQEHSVDAGDCHRYPLIFTGHDGPNERHRWNHPHVLQSDWCGEFKRYLLT